MLLVFLVPLIIFLLSMSCRSNFYLKKMSLDQYLDNFDTYFNNGDDNRPKDQIE